VRKNVCSGLKHLGIELDDNRNESTLGPISKIQKNGAESRILMVRTDEELEIARQTIRVIEESKRVA
jgi:acetate kinase